CHAPHLVLHSFPTRRSSDLSEFRTFCPTDLASFAVIPPLIIARNPLTQVVRYFANSFGEPAPSNSPLRIPYWIAASNVFCTASRSEEHTSELQSRENLVCRL